MSVQTADVLEGVFAVDEGDDVHLAVHNYDWASPYEVVDVDHVEWLGATGETWTTREVLVEGGYGSTFAVAATEGDQDLELRTHPGGQKRGDLVQFEPVDESGTSTEDDTTELSEAPDVDLEEDATDDDADGSDDDVQKETDAEEITVDGVDDVQDDEDETEVALPDGVTPGDVEAAVDEHYGLGDVADEIGVTRGRARTITVALGCYGDVSDVPSDRGLIDPRALGLLVLVVGMLFTAAIALGVNAA
ncbi:hypothetical protein [Natronorubrum halophilum]|uniref:hypothetical protein n=1 Tax=Natronorubrum halophilum TaxID=1702106 RepID=UPI0010C1D09A|nr:hypothetical protein [Natronorubrum halophilum]